MRFCRFLYFLVLLPWWIFGDGEYNYGHNLDPNAAIIVPGMAYQPPLIGFKQLLNFGAFSIPDKGGWLFILSGVCMLLATVFETGVLKKFSKKKGLAATAIVFLSFGASCSYCRTRTYCDQ